MTYAIKEFDKETGLYYLNSRMYDPTTARFLQEDTYTGDPNDPLSLNLYTYCENEPIMYTDPTGYARGDWWDFSYFGENFKAVCDFFASSDEERDSTVVNIRHDDDESISNPVSVKVSQIFNGIAKIGSAATTVSKAKTLGEKEAVAVGASQSILDNFVVMPAIYLQYCADTLFLGQDYADRHYSETMQNRNTFENTVKEYAVVNDSENVDRTYNASRLLTDTTITTVGTIKLGLDANKFVQNIAKGSPWDTTPKAAVAGSNVTVDYSNFYRDLYKSKPNIVNAVENSGKKVGSGKEVVNGINNSERLNAGVGEVKGNGIKPNYQGYVKGDKGQPPPNFSPEGAGKNGAFREAKRASGVPVNQQPSKIVEPGIGNNGKPVEGGGIDYYFKDSNGNEVVIRQHNKHIYEDDPIQNRGTHFNDKNGNHYDYDK